MLKNCPIRSLRGLARLKLLVLVGATSVAGAGATANAQGNIAQRTDAIEMPGRIAPTLRWTMRVNGLCGQMCRNGPRHMYQAAFGDTLLVSWMAVDEADTWRQYGNVATFQVSASGEFTKTGDVSFDGVCSAVYGLTANDDGSVIALLCEGVKDAPLLPGATDLLGTLRTPDCAEDWEGRCYPIGHFSEIDAPLYIFEYTGGAVTETPDRIVRVNHAVGGWRYGHHEIALNAAEDTYFLALKVTAGPSEDNRHEGLKHFAVSRATDWDYVRVTDEWGCGPGHVLANRVAYNESADAWGKLCNLDWCALPNQYENSKCHSTTFFTVPGVTEAQQVEYDGAELVSYDHPARDWTLSGGGHTLLSLGADGWLAVASGPGNIDSTPKPATIGLMRLPLTVPGLRELGTTESVIVFEDGGTSTAEHTSYDWRWLSLPAPAPERAEHARAGMGNAAYFGTAGEQSERLLLGWSPSVETQGITSEYVVQEIDRDGMRRGEPLTLDAAGWGEDNRWTTMPGSGCVVFPFAWVGDGGPGASYPIEGSEDPTVYTRTLRMTSLCPTGDSAPPVNEPEPAPTPGNGGDGSSGTASGGCDAAGRAPPLAGALSLLAIALLWRRRRAALASTRNYR